MVWDGLRPDYVTPTLTPRLHALAAEGVRFANSHAVFPTFTRCNSASIATGFYPAQHGIPGNRFVAPEIESGRVFNAADHEHLELLRHARGRILLVDTLGDALAATGRKTAVLGTGSPGAALLQHPEVAQRGDLMLHPAMWTGVTPEELTAARGRWPDKTRPNTEQNAYFTTLLTDYLLPEHDPSLIHYWHTDPDHTSHSAGVGHPDTLRSITDADTNLGAILDALDRLGMRGETDVVVTSDHGFSTVTAPLPIAEALVEAGVKRDVESGDVLDAEGAICVHDHDAGTIRRVVEALQGMESVGAIFTGAHGNPVLPGTTDLALIGHGGTLCPDVLVSGDWTSDENEHGYRGTCFAGHGNLRATHGSASPWDIRNTLIVAGPSFKRGVVSEAPAGNIDIAPTLRCSLGLPSVEADGRVLVEALIGGPEPASLAVRREVVEAESADRRFRQRVHRSHVDMRDGSGGASYLDYVEAEHA